MQDTTATGLTMCEMYPICEIYPISDRKATITDIHIHLGRFVYDVQGSSYRMKDDKYDEDLGNLIAFTRAMERALNLMKKDIRRSSNGTAPEVQ